MTEDEDLNWESADSYLGVMRLGDTVVYNLGYVHNVDGTGWEYNYTPTDVQVSMQQLSTPVVRRRVADWWSSVDAHYVTDDWAREQMDEIDQIIAAAGEEG